MKSSTNKSYAEAAPLNGGEPRAGTSTTPVVVVFVLLGLLLFWGGIYIDRHGGGFDPRVYSKYGSIAEVRKANPATGGVDPEKGKAVYEKYCLPCHQANGMGLAGQFPPLGGSEWVLAPSPARVISIVLDGVSGPITVKGEQYNSAMPPWREALKDEDIAAVATYVRSAFGNKASPATVDQVKKIREETNARGGAPWSSDDLLKVPESE